MRTSRVLAFLLLVVALGGALGGGAAGPAAAAADAATALAPVYAAAVPGPAPDRPAAVEAPGAALPAPAAVTPAPARAAAGVRAASAREAVAPAPVAAAPGRAPGTPCRATVRACVDRATNQAWLISGGTVSYGPVPITHGRRGFRTPAGTFDVDFHSRNHVSSIYDAPMPYSVFFNGGIAFHQGSLRERSHGCIHLARSAAREFFDALRRGDLVQVV